MSDHQPDAPKIEFPCENYPIKVLGDAGDELPQLVVEVMERHAPGFDQSRIRVKASRNGTYQSLTVWITATGEPQLKSIHQELIASSVTKMVL
ncbi:YbeD family protein [Marinimicrobium sp. ARAG 43.8]|uniref:YbeD family protein n=1 Tax=Marinimicrobium sp. ARAG 43.8 TaxID=3418719 RepID=UPI003CEF821B